jgi:hypothetical protein
MAYQAKDAISLTLSAARNTHLMAQIVVDAIKVKNVTFFILDFAMTPLNLDSV